MAGISPLWHVIPLVNIPEQVGQALIHRHARFIECQITSTGPPRLRVQLFFLLQNKLEAIFFVRIIYNSVKAIYSAIFVFLIIFFVCLAKNSKVNCSQFGSWKSFSNGPETRILTVRNIMYLAVMSTKSDHKICGVWLSAAVLPKLFFTRFHLLKDATLWSAMITRMLARILARNSAPTV
jgi:hypothetical protein